MASVIGQNPDSLEISSIAHGPDGAQWTTVPVSIALPSSSSPDVEDIDVHIVEHGWEGPPGPQSEQTASQSGLIYITDVVSLDDKVVGGKQYLAGTVPPDIILERIKTLSGLVKVTVIILAGFDQYTPSAIIEGVSVIDIVESGTKRYYYGTAVIELAESTDSITARLGSGISHSIIVDRQEVSGPLIDEVIIGAYPGTQTELKEDDEVEISVITSVDTVSVTILESDAIHETELSVQEYNSGGITRRLASGLVRVKAVNGEFRVRARAINFDGVYSDVVASNGKIKLNQTKPSFTSIKLAYSDNNLAAKPGDIISIVVDAQDFDGILYESEVLDIPNARSYEHEKSATVVGSTTQPLEITLIRASNGTYLVGTIDIPIVTKPASAVLSILGDEDGVLYKSALGTSYTVVLKCDQPLRTPPKVSLNIDPAPGWIYSSEREQYEAIISLFRETEYLTVEITSVELSGPTGVPSTDAVFDKVYKIVEQVTGTFYVSKRSRMLELPYNINANYKVSLFDQFPLRYRSTVSDYPLGYCILDDLNNPVENGSRIYFTDSSFAGANTSGLLSVSVTSTGDNR